MPRKCQAFSAKKSKLFYIFVNNCKINVKSSKQNVLPLAFAP